MGSTTIEYRTLPGTAAAVGRAGRHSVVADRSEGIAGGMGLGFNGGELLALALGGCFCNDVQYVAGEMGLLIDSLRVTVTIDFDGRPVVATGARMEVECTLEDGLDPAELLERAKGRCTVANSLGAGLPVTVDS